MPSLSEETCKTGKAMREETSPRIRVPEIDLDRIKSSSEDTSERKSTRTKSLKRTHSKGLLRFLSCSLSPLGTVAFLGSVCTWGEFCLVRFDDSV